MLIVWTEIRVDFTWPGHVCRSVSLSITQSLVLCRSQGCTYLANGYMYSPFWMSKPICHCEKQLAINDDDGIDFASIKKNGIDAEDFARQEFFDFTQLGHRAFKKPERLWKRK